MSIEQKPTQRQQQAQQRREQIMEVGLDLFSSQGFAATSTRQISQQVGITEGLLYHYYPTKAGLLMEIVKRRHLLEGGLIALLETAKGRPLRSFMEDLIARIVLLAHEHAALLRILLGESQTNEELYGALCDTIETMIQLLVDYLASRVRVGEVRGDISLQASTQGFLGGMFLFFMTHHRLDAAQWQQQSGAFMQEWLDSWLLGVQIP
ncbi:TetR family transcriptional regulator [Dictyobacter alpinus]|uniref:TetR family transcriptional regulator n=1 Tax=Dictyobacter alpinus TaxID=2014873 RepID=A0A402BFY8_9CHLR|nr:TetR/AcrR family transcriptional regulator [Dictyobacter alpinus]GCE30177.1 TetR family transcriptional regulator [Dictyobacter alpinus]